ncbi:MAG: glycosyl hydrolase family 65 protein, partial [Acholeplasmataceae bacterium]
GYEYFKKVAELDFRDNHNRTQHGLHVANLGGSYLMLMYGIFGLRFGPTLRLHPMSQKQIKHIQTKFIYQGVSIKISMQLDTVVIDVDQPLDVCIYNELITIKKTYKMHIKSL